MKKQAYQFLLLFIFAVIHVEISAQQLRLETNNKKLENTFQWAVKKALSFRMTGKKEKINYEMKPLR